MRYGLPYKGSKNGIAEWIVDSLPNDRKLIAGLEMAEQLTLF